MDGVPVIDQDGNRLGDSKIAAKEGIGSVVLSRILMASPGMSNLKRFDLLREIKRLFLLFAMSAGSFVKVYL